MKAQLDGSDPMQFVNWCKYTHSPNTRCEESHLGEQWPVVESSQKISHLQPVLTLSGIIVSVFPTAATQPQVGIAKQLRQANGVQTILLKACREGNGKV